MFRFECEMDDARKTDFHLQPVLCLWLQSVSVHRQCGLGERKLG